MADLEGDFQQLHDLLGEYVAENRTIASKAILNKTLDM
jgi:hypothetical protein